MPSDPMHLHVVMISEHRRDRWRRTHMFHHAIVSLTHGSSSSSSMSMMGIVDALFIESCRPVRSNHLEFPRLQFFHSCVDICKSVGLSIMRKEVVSYSSGS